MRYFNGTQTFEANDINKLAELSQDEANLLAVGPQELFFSKLEAINSELERFGVEPIDVTNKWNWRPGSYDKIKQYMYKKLELNKKAMSVSKIMMRAQDRINYMNFIQRQATAMESERANLKRLGVSRDVDIDEFKDKCIEFVDNLISSCEKAYQVTQEKVLIVPYISLDEGRHSRLFLDIMLKDMVLSVYDGHSAPVLIQEIPLQPIHISLTMPLRHNINNMNLDVTSNGMYKSEGPVLAHPYISFRYSNNNGYGTVCLDRYFDDVKKACRKNDMISLSMTLMQWAQYYNIKVANPYNQPYMSHLGMPEYFSSEYKATQPAGSVTDRCGRTLYKFASKIGSEHFEADEVISKTCNNIKCSVKDLCNSHMNISRRIDNLESEWGCQVESFVMMVVDWLWEEYAGENGDLSAMNVPLSFLIGDDAYVNGQSEEEYKEYVINKLLWYYANSLKQEFDDYTYNFLERYHFIDKIEEEPPSVTDMDEEQVKIIMKSWAETQGGR